MSSFHDSLAAEDVSNDRYADAVEELAYELSRLAGRTLDEHAEDREALRDASVASAAFADLARSGSDSSSIELAFMTTINAALESCDQAPTRWAE